MLMTPPSTERVSRRRSRGLPTMAAMRGLMMSATREFTMLVKAAPMMTGDGEVDNVAA